MASFLLALILSKQGVIIPVEIAALDELLEMKSHCCFQIHWTRKKKGRRSFFFP